jgi:hypothetical protein
MEAVRGRSILRYRSFCRASVSSLNCRASWMRSAGSDAARERRTPIPELHDEGRKVSGQLLY